MNLCETIHEVDIAGIISERQKVTVAGFGGLIHNYAVELPAQDNQQINFELGIDKMGKKKRKIHNLKIYASMVYCLLRTAPPTIDGVVVLDTDLDKRSLGKAKKAIKQTLRNERIEVNYRIEIRQLGNGAAHKVCNAVYREHRDADYILGYKECIEIMHRLRIT